MKRLSTCELNETLVLLTIGLFSTDGFTTIAVRFNVENNNSMELAFGRIETELVKILVELVLVDDGTGASKLVVAACRLVMFVDIVFEVDEIFTNTVE